MSRQDSPRARARQAAAQLSHNGDPPSSPLPNVAPDAARFLPVLIRALDLGRGPPSLMQWLTEKLAIPSRPASDGQSPVLHQLAMELASRIDTPYAKVTPVRSEENTLTTRDFETICAITTSSSAYDNAACPERELAPQGTATNDVILLTEDDSSVRSLVQYILKVDGYEVLEAQSGPEAINVANAYHGRIALLITDIFMPEMTGPQLSKSLITRRPDLKVLFLSGSNEEVLTVYGLSEADGQLLQKPFTPTQLLAVVRQILAG